MFYISDTDLAFRATLDGSGFASGAQAINGHLADMGLRTGTATANLGGLGTMLGTMANPMTAVALGAGAVGAALSSSIGVAANFQSSMSNVSSVLGGGKEDFQKLSDAAREAGSTTAFSASQAADGLYFLASAGYSTNDTILALKDTLNLAGAGGMDLARSAEMITTDLAVFGLTASDATYATDLLATAAKKSNTTVAQMGDALARVGGMANSAGLSMKETTSVLEVMANTGVKGSEAGTKLNAILGVLLKTSSSSATKEQANAMKEMGIAAEQLNPTLHSQEEIWGLLAEKHMNAAQSLAIFGTENTATASNITANSGLIKTFAGDLDNASGAAGKMSAEMNDNFNGAMKEMSSAIEEAQISIGNEMLPSLTEFVKVATSASLAAIDFGKSLDTWIKGIGLQEDSGVATPFINQMQDWIKSSDEWLMGGNVGEKTGEEIAENIGNGIEKKEGDIAAKTKKTLSSDEMMKASADAAQKAADEWVSKFGDAAEKGMMFIGGKWTSEQEVKKSQEDTTFKMQDQEYILRRLIDGDATRYQLLDAQKNVIEDTGIIYEKQLNKFSPTEWAKSMLTGPKTVSWEEILDPNKKAASQAKELGEKVASAMTDGIATEAEKKEMFGLARQLDDFRTKNATEWGKIGTDASNAYIDAMLAGDWGKVNDLAEKVGADFMDSLTGALLGTKDTRSLAQVVQDILSGKETISSPKNFQENTWQPGLKKSFADMYEEYQKGYGDDIALAKTWIEDKQAIYTDHADWFNKWQQSLFDMYAGGDVSVREFVDVWDKMSDTSKKTSDATKKQSTNVLDLAKSIDTAEEAMSAFGIAQEMMAADLFRSDYVGGDTEAWAANYAKETQEIARTQENVRRMKGVSVGQQYAYEPLVEEMDLDISKAVSSKDNLLTEIQNSNPEMTLALDTNAAYTAWGHLVQDIEALQPVMRVDVEFSANSMQLRQMVAEILADAAS